MEPKKKIKKLDTFKQSLKRIMELPLGGVLGVLRVDAERPQVQMETVNLPLRVGDIRPRMMGRMGPKPIRVRFRNNSNISETQLQDSILDWAHDGGKKNISIKTLDTKGIEIERWDLKGCFPSEVGYYPINDGEEQHYLEMTLHCTHFNLKSF